MLIVLGGLRLMVVDEVYVWFVGVVICVGYILLGGVVGLLDWCLLCCIGGEVFFELLDDLWDLVGENVEKCLGVVVVCLKVWYFFDVWSVEVEFI